MHGPIANASPAPTAADSPTNPRRNHRFRTCSCRARGRTSRFRERETSDSWSLAGSVGAPAGRREHTAVWTGDEMIIWAGGSDNDSLGDGGRYDPVPRTWTALSVDDAPRARHHHTAVWSGEAMILWGGRPFSGGGPGLRSGGVYLAAPDTDSDGVADADDCVPDNASAFHPPSEIAQVPLAHRQASAHAWASSTGSPTPSAGPGPAGFEGPCLARNSADFRAGAATKVSSPHRGRSSTRN